MPKAAFKQCEVPGCDKTGRLRKENRTRCDMHDARFRRNGHSDLTRRANGAGNVNLDGYLDVRVDDGRRTYEHIAVAERALGKRLPEGCEVHHVNENRIDKRGANLVICPSTAYHRLLHQRMAARDACGNADWRKCQHCQQYDAPERLNMKRVPFHTECAKSAARARYLKRKAANV